MWIKAAAYGLIFLTTNLLLAFTEEQTEDILNERTEDILNDKTCNLNPEDAERAQFMLLSHEDQARRIQDFALLSMEEKETLLELSSRDLNSVKTCKDNHELFNETVFSELNLFYILESHEGPQLVRNSTSFAVLGLEPDKVKCKYSLVKSDADSDVDDSQYDIPLDEKAINLEGPHNTVGVVCTATVDTLRHLPTVARVNCGGHKAASCLECGSHRNRCNGECVWTDDQCSEPEPDPVDCGAHEAATCFECVTGENPTDEARCSGDCVWKGDYCAHPSQKETRKLFTFSLPKPKKVRVNCGGHKADSCYECGSHRTRCNGECVWTDDHCEHRDVKKSQKQFKIESIKNNIVEFYSDVFMFVYKSNASLVDCGGHRAVNCSQCSVERRGCNGQCVWREDHCVGRGAGNVPAYSVLVFCLDTTSKFSFSRNLPKTLKYLKNQGGVVLNKHHKQGHDTYPNYLPLLSGALDQFGKFKGTMNHITEKHKLNWAWEHWRNAGLPNIYHEDMPKFGPFNAYGREGWENRSPFMHYHRSAFHAMDSDKFNIRNGDLKIGYQCMGNTASYKRQLALLRMFARTYKDVSNIGIWNLCEYTHDTTNLVRVMDQDLHDTFKELIEGGYTKRTLVIVMGDHGRTYGIPGKAGWLESHSPMMMLLIPEAMKEEMPGVNETVLKNSWKVTTMQDIYKTITDPVITRKEPEGDVGGLSLLHPIPSRTCEEASVPQAHCTCRQEKIDVTDPTLIEHANEIIREINQKVENNSQCHPLRLHHVEWAFRDGSIYHMQLFAQKLKNEEGLYSFHAVSKFKEEFKGPVSCGGHKAKSCLECGSNWTRCNGECIWMGSYCSHKNPVYKEKENSTIFRTDFYSPTSFCIQDANLRNIKPFCICASQ